MSTLSKTPKGVKPQTPLGILKSTPVRGSSPQRRNSGVHFQPPPKLGEILKNYDSGSIASIGKLEEFVTHMRNQRGQGLIDWLQVLQENIVYLKPKLEMFVIQVLKTAWLIDERPVIKAFQLFLTNLATAHTFYVKPILLMLIKNINNCAHSPNYEQEVKEKVYDNIHETIEALLTLIPLQSRTILLEYCKECLPYMLIPNEEVHTNYITQLIRIYRYLSYKEDKNYILRIIIERLIQLDARLPKLTDYESDDSEDDDDGDDVDMDDTTKIPQQLSEVSIARCNLDNAMNVMFKFLENRIKNRQKKKIFMELLPIFESFILPTYATDHVQFLIFYLLSQDDKGKITNIFLDFLWLKFCNPNTSRILRQSTVFYIASLIARGKFISLDLAKQCLKKLTEWIHNYIDNCEDLKSHDFMYTNMQRHGSFYAACQSAFYIFAFRHQEFFEDKTHLSYLRGLNLGTIVTCNLNPLRVCTPIIVQNFSSISRHYQLVYCQTIIERNNRINLPVIGSSGETGRNLCLDTFFPFDPYSLTISEAFIQDHYRVYNGTLIIPEEKTSEFIHHQDEIINDDFDKTFDINQELDDMLCE